MEIKSDKQNKKNPNAFTKAYNYIVNDFWRTIFLITLPILTYIWFTFFPDDYLWLMFSAVGAVFGIGLLTNGELFKDLKAMMFIYVVVFLAVTGIWYGVTPQKTETDTIDLKPFIVDIKSNKDKDAFVINNKLPFESNVEVRFNSMHQFDALFVNKEHFDEFSITVTKTCSIYRIKDISCDTVLKINHKDSGDDLVTKTLYNSVYPKKLAIESEVQ